MTYSPCDSSAGVDKVIGPRDRPLTPTPPTLSPEYPGVPGRGGEPMPATKLGASARRSSTIQAMHIAAAIAAKVPRPSADSVCISARESVRLLFSLGPEIPAG